MNGAVITAKDEAETIGALVKNLKQQGFEVCVVDDGSTDDTGAFARGWGAHVIHHEESEGIGKSLMDAWDCAIEKKWEYTIQIDAGGSHDPQEIPALWTHDVLIGSRFLPSSKYIGRKWRATASKITARLLNFATHKQISDWTSGYRIFSLAALEVLRKNHYLTNMHTWQIEVLNYAIENGLTVVEFPITYRAGNSTLKMRTIDDFIKVYLWIFNR